MSRKAIGLTLALAAVFAPVTAFASSYALSYSQITNFTLTGASISGWTFSQDMGINGSYSNANGSAGPAGGSLDVAAVCVPASPCSSITPNSFASHGAIGSGYTYADALIGSSAITTAPGGSASAIAETYVTGADAGLASSSNSLTATMAVGGTGNVSFDFDVISYLAVILSGSGGTGNAWMTFSASITPVGSSLSVWSLLPTALNASVGPGDAAYSVPDIGNAITGHYNGTASLVAGGTYSLNISMTQNVSAVSAVPVPAAAWLLGSGLLGLVAVARRNVR